MLKKISFMTLMIIFIYSLFPILFILTYLNIPESIVQIIQYLITLLIILTYILSFIDLVFLCKKEEYNKIIKLSLFVKLLSLPIVFILLLFGILTLIVIIGSALIILGLGFGLLFMFLTSLYSSIGLYNYYKKENQKCKIPLIISQWIFPIDIIVLIFVLVSRKIKNGTNKNLTSEFNK